MPAPTVRDGLSMLRSHLEVGHSWSSGYRATQSVAHDLGRLHTPENLTL